VTNSTAGPLIIIIIYLLRQSSLHTDIKTIKAVNIKNDNTKKH